MLEQGVERAVRHLKAMDIAFDEETVASMTESRTKAELFASTGFLFQEML